MKNQTKLLRLFLLFILSVLINNQVLARGTWHQGNLKGIEDLSFRLNVRGIDDDVWEKRLSSFIELRLLEHGIEFVDTQMPRMVVDISIIDSRIDAVSSYLVMLSLYNYGVSESEYYQSMADTLITKKLMTSKVFSREIMGQTSSKKMHRDVEKVINTMISAYIDQWFKDNPLKQF